MMLTLPDIQALIPVIDAGIKAAGIQLFQNDGGAKLQAAIDKLQAMAEEAQGDTTKEGES